jgi:hypothetical protein
LLQVPFRGFTGIFALLQARLSPSTKVGGGKSGQQRTTHRLTAGPDSDREESATENYRQPKADKGENVR